jgi:hypothetical protein
VSTITFGLLRDADAVVVSIHYAGKVDEKTVYLEKDASANIVMAQSVQFSQEADLGGQAVYDLQLERFTDEENVFRLAVVGLPRDVRHEFRDPVTGARLSQIRFPEGQSQRSLQLVLSLPQRSADGIRMDEPLLSMRWCWTARRMRSWHVACCMTVPTPAAACRAAAGRATMELVPARRRPDQVRTANLYHEVRRGGLVSMEVELRNGGSRRLDNVRVQVETPLHWTARVEPEFIASWAWTRSSESPSCWSRRRTVAGRRLRGADPYQLCRGGSPCRDGGQDGPHPRRVGHELVDHRAADQPAAHG